MSPIQNPAVAKAFDSYPEPIRRDLMVLRTLIFNTAAATVGVGQIEEALRWGEPAYLTPQSGSGSTLRLGWKPARPMQYAMYFHCQTTLIETFRALFPNEFRFEGNRALIFQQGAPIPTEALAFCIAAALTYHRRAQSR